MAVPLSTIRSLAKGLMDLVLPGHCPKCGASVDRAGALCSSCWSKIKFISDPVCSCCGLPMQINPGLGFDSLCGSCHQHPPVYDQARAVFIYEPESRDLILRFKHGDRTDLTPEFIPWLHRIGRDVLSDADIIVPVPLHWSRLLSRRYNQAAELARGLASISGVSYQPDLLQRHRRTPSQGQGSRSQRSKNVRGAFRVNPAVRSTLNGVNAVLIDDVLTTGATANACAKVLKKNGCDRVTLLTLARVP